jgi:hypothetical protein
MQTNAAGATRDEQHSLAPIQLETSDLKRDLASIRRGQGRRLALALLGSLVAMAGLLLWMKAGDGHLAYAAAAKQLDALYAQQEAAFPDCRLLDANSSQDVMRTSIEAASQQLGKAYEKQLEPCTRALVMLERQLGEVDVPISMEHRVEGLQRSTSALNRAIGRYRSYLFDPKLNYDYASATTHIDNVMVAWTNYDRQRQNTIDALRSAAHPTKTR